MSAQLDALTAAERRVVDAVAAVRDEAPEEALSSLGEEGKPAVEDGRLVRLKLFKAPPRLDLRGLDALVEVWTVWDAGLAELVLGEHPRLVRLALRNNKLTSLQLGGCRALAELDVSRNAITTLADLPASLRKLDCNASPVGSINLASAAALEELVATGCKLTSLDVDAAPALRVLAIGGNQVRALDVSAHRALTELHVEDNGARLVLPDAATLTMLRASGNPIESVDASRWPALVDLRLARCGLRSLRLDNPSLEVLDVADDQLAVLDLRAARRVERLSLQGNPLPRVDVSQLPRLSEATFPAEAEVVCTELQQHVIPELRERFGLSKATTSVAKMDAFQLHRFVQGYNWDDGVKKLLEVVRHPACDLATALLVYWMSEPGEYAEHREAASAPKSEQKMVELLREIEARVQAGGFASQRIPFDVTDEDGTDLSNDDPRIPDAMRRPVKAAAGAVVVAPPKPAAKKKAPTKKK